MLRGPLMGLDALGWLDSVVKRLIDYLAVYDVHTLAIQVFN